MSQGAWLVTGASGFLGRHLLTELETGSEPRQTLALVRSEDEWRKLDWTCSLLSTGTLTGSVTDTTAWSKDPRLDDLAGIFHLAALVRHCRRDGAEVLDTNVRGTVAMVRLAAERKCRMVFVSTSGTVGCFRDPEGTADEDSPFCEAVVSGWPYYRSKIEAEREARRLADQLGVSLVIVRPPVLLGPGDHRFRSTNHVSRFLRGKLPFLVRGGMHFADVRDAARALAAAMGREQPRPVYHLPGTASSIEEFFAGTARIAGRKPPRLVLPYRAAWWLARLGAPLGLLPDPVIVEMAAHYWGMTSRYAECDLGYRSRPPEDTLTDTVAWLMAHHPALAP
ncbi:MAG TPA: NAD-dependent epimerase/dehydratase family protein [Gemmatimonadales bacterium]|nr:NAD-dependent epimerase/dehydratase family protein [Gemmatimonadales bacterium]